MSIAVKDIRNHKISTTYFSHPKATLPVKMKDGSIQYVKWGRRIHEQYLELPTGSCAMLESLRQGVWDRYMPKPVKVLVEEFAEEDKATGVNNWFEIVEGHYIQGVAATDKQETRVYIVAIKTDVESNYARWPRILASKAVSEK
jgi:hypothetical protein